MNSRSGARHSRRRTRRLGGVGVSLVFAAAAFLAIPGGASASIQPTCAGKLGLNKHTTAGVNGVQYSFKCNTDFQAFALTSSKKIDYFTPDPTVLEPSGDPSPSDHFSCEGAFPGWGFGCPGAGTHRNSVEGIFATINQPCSPPVRAWVSITYQNLDSHDAPFTSQSHPFALKVPAGCTASSRSRTEPIAVTELTGTRKRAEKPVNSRNASNPRTEGGTHAQ